MKKLSRIAAIVIVAVLPASCAAMPPPPMGEPVATVYVASNDWHTSIIVARADLPTGSVAEAADFPASRFLEFGWGDAAFYQDTEPGIATALRAGLWPTPSVLHVAGFDSDPSVRYPKAVLEAVQFDATGFTALVDFIDGSFARGDGVRVAAIGPGLSTDSRFYPAKGNFHILYTCNTWTASALRHGGLDIDVGTSKFANSLMVQIREVRWEAEGWPGSGRDDAAD
ncbi:MAG: DUF2459 domain-containing protein [Alphaproteobacteria bacterium]